VFVHSRNGERESRRRVREQLFKGDSKSFLSKSLKDLKASFLFDSLMCAFSLSFSPERTRNEKREKMQRAAPHPEVRGERAQAGQSKRTRTTHPQAPHTLSNQVRRADKAQKELTHHKQPRKQGGSEMISE